MAGPAAQAAQWPSPCRHALQSQHSCQLIRSHPDAMQVPPAHLEAAHHLAQVRARQLNIQLQAVLLLHRSKTRCQGALGCVSAVQKVCMLLGLGMHRPGGIGIWCSAGSMPTPTNHN